MGSSLGLALKQRGAPVKVHAYARRPQTREAAAVRGAADEMFAHPADAVEGADLVVFCVPVLSIPELTKACLPGLRSGMILTDVGSTKAKLDQMMNELIAGTGTEFIGSHPICGSEMQGIEAGSGSLYDGSVTVVTPSIIADEHAVEKISELWKMAGSMVSVMSPEEHDRILAATSHLPHVAAAALVLSGGVDGTLCGNGFRDSTRIAEGSPDVWADIAKTNGPALKKALKGYCENIYDLVALIDEGDREKLAAWFASARDKRRELLG